MLVSNNPPDFEVKVIGLIGIAPVYNVFKFLAGIRGLVMEPSFRFGTKRVAANLGVRLEIPLCFPRDLSTGDEVQIQERVANSRGQELQKVLRPDAKLVAFTWERSLGPHAFSFFLPVAPCPPVRKRQQQHYPLFIDPTLVQDPPP